MGIPTFGTPDDHMEANGDGLDSIYTRSAQDAAMKQACISYWGQVVAFMCLKNYPVYLTHHPTRTVLLCDSLAQVIKRPSACRCKPKLFHHQPGHRNREDAEIFVASSSTRKTGLLERQPL